MPNFSENFLFQLAKFCFSILNLWSSEFSILSNIIFKTKGDLSWSTTHSNRANPLSVKLRIIPFTAEALTIASSSETREFSRTLKI